jgi:hypothetical protein
MEDIEKLAADKTPRVTIADQALPTARHSGVHLRLGSRKYSSGQESRHDNDEITPIPQNATVPIEYRTL